MLRVGFNARGLRDGSLRGGQRYTYSLMRALARLPEATITLFTDDRSPLHPIYRRDLCFTTVESRAPRVLWWEQVQLPHLLSTNQIQVFHAPVEGGLPARKACRYVLTYHGVPEEGLARLIRHGELRGRLADFVDGVPPAGPKGWWTRARFEFLRSLYVRSADRIITVSTFSKRELVDCLRIPEAKIRVVYNGVDHRFSQPVAASELAEVARRYKLPARYVLYVGGYDRHKNAVQLVRVFQAVKSSCCDVGLVLVGTGGPVEECRNAVRDAGLCEGQDVWLLSGVPDDDLSAIYRGASVFVTLAWHEGFCMPVLEAMASDVPVIATRFGALPEIVDGAALLVDPRDVAGVSQAIRAVLQQPELRDDLRRRARARAALFSWERSAAQTLAVYQELVPPASGAA